MRSWLAFAALCALFALGCATPYRIELRSGEILESTDEPELDRDAGFFVFQDRTGREIRVNRDDVVSMEAR
jgi:Bacterial protein of unknown function (DUF903)